MIRIEISLGREPSQAVAPAQARQSVVGRSRGAGALLAVAAATLMFSFVPAPNLPNAAMLAAPHALSLAPAAPHRFAVLPERRANFDEIALATTRAAFANVQAAADQAARVDDEIVADTSAPAAQSGAPARAPTREEAAQDERARSIAEPLVAAPSIDKRSIAELAVAEETTKAQDVSSEPNDVPAPFERASEPVPMSFSIARAISSGEETLINQVTDLLTAGDWRGADAALRSGHWSQSVPLAKLAARAALMDEAALPVRAATRAVVVLQPLTAQLDGEGQRLLAAALMRAERPSEAVGIYRALLVAAPADAELWMGLALALDASGAAHSATVYAYQQARELSVDARVQRLAELRIAALA